MPRRARPLATITLFAAASLALTLSALWPRTTFAEAVTDAERQGEWDEDGAKFGNVVVKGELVADGTVPNGWVLVRTLENKGDEPETCQIEERILRTETMPAARVRPPPYAVLLRGVTVTLRGHEKRTLGIPLPASIGAQISANLRLLASIERGRERALTLERYRDPVFAQTYMEFEVEYLKPLPPGATVAKVDTGVTRPMGMPMMMPPPVARDGGAFRDDFL